MIDVTIANFEEEVVAASMTVPVLLDFWAPWCGPCKSLGPILEKVEIAYGGRFKLVKIDSDQEQQIAAAFSIRSIPTCILMMNGQPVDGFAGALPEGQVKEFLDKHLPPTEELPEEELTLEEESTEPAEVLEKLQQTLATNPADEAARFDYVKLLLLHGQTDAARAAFAPVAANTGLNRKFGALQLWLGAIDAAQGDGDKAVLEGRIAADRRDFDARFALAQWHMARQQWTDAMDALLDILMRDKTWNDEAARKAVVAVLDIIEPPKVKVADGQIPPDDPLVATYRRRLSSVILS